MTQAKTIRPIWQHSAAVDYTPNYSGKPNQSDWASSLTFNIEAYNRGKKDAHAEMIKMGNALLELALNKSSNITERLIDVAKQNNIKIFEFYLKIENWDNVKSLIIVTLDDYTDDRISALYEEAQRISSEVNDGSFHWEYIITYLSDNISDEKIISDGYSYHYEHTPKPRKTQ